MIKKDGHENKQGIQNTEPPKHLKKSLHDCLNIKTVKFFPQEQIEKEAALNYKKGWNEMMEAPSIAHYQRDTKNPSLFIREGALS